MRRVCWARGCDQERWSGTAPRKKWHLSQHLRTSRRLLGEGWWDSAPGGGGCMHKSPEGAPSSAPPSAPESVSTDQRYQVGGLCDFAGVCSTPQDWLLGQFSVAKPRPLVYEPLDHKGTASVVWRRAVWVFGSGSKDVPRTYWCRAAGVHFFMPQLLDLWPTSPSRHPSPHSWLPGLSWKS